MLQRLGFEICSGGIIGMGESHADVVDMLLELREIAPQALPINFLLPIPGTPLEHIRHLRSYDRILPESPLSCPTDGSTDRS